MSDEWLERCPKLLETNTGVAYEVALSEARTRIFVRRLDGSEVWTNDPRIMHELLDNSVQMTMDL